VSHLITFLLGNSILGHPETIENFFIPEFSPAVRIHSLSPAIKFYDNSPERYQLHLTIYLPVDRIAQHLSTYVDTLPCPIPAEMINNSHSQITKLALLHALPLEIQLKIVESLIMDFLPSSCECYLLECTQEFHNSRCKRGLGTAYSRYPRLFPVRFVHTAPDPSNPSLTIGLQCIYTFESNQSLGTPPPYAPVLPDRLTRQFIILCHEHGQFSIPHEIDSFSLPSIERSVNGITPGKPTQYITRFPLGSCPTSTGRFLPMSRHGYGHTLVFD
jgi:hypothetical protein